MAEVIDAERKAAVATTKITFANDPFDSVLKQMSELHSRKAQHYGSETDPYANVHASSELGIEPWRGVLNRINEKMIRLKSYIRRGETASPGVMEEIKDIQVYAVIAQILYEEENGK